MVVVWSISPVQDSLFGGSLDSASGGLVDVDVGDAGFVDVLLDGEGDGGEVDGFALEPADALEGEDGVGWVGEGLGLEVLLAGASHGRVEGRERTYHDVGASQVGDGGGWWCGHFCSVTAVLVCVWFGYK